MAMQAKADGKHLVSTFWLNDVLESVSFVLCVPFVLAAVVLFFSFLLFLKPLFWIKNDDQGQMTPPTSALHFPQKAGRTPISELAGALIGLTGFRELQRHVVKELVCSLRVGVCWRLRFCFLYS